MYYTRGAQRPRKKVEGQALLVQYYLQPDLFILTLTLYMTTIKGINYLISSRY